MADVVYFYARKDDLDVLYEVPRDLLKAFGLKFGMIDADHADNMAQLLDRTRSGKRHLNGIQPLSKTVWIKPWTRSIEKFEHHRPRPATAPDFYDNFIRRLNREKNGEKAKIADKAKPTFGKFLNGTYFPAGKPNGPAEQYRQWQLTFVSVQEAKQLMDFRPAAIWNTVNLPASCDVERVFGGVLGSFIAPAHAVAVLAAGAAVSGRGDRPERRNVERHGGKAKSTPQHTCMRAPWALPLVIIRYQARVWRRYRPVYRPV